MKQNIRLAIIDNSIDPSIYSPVEHWSRYLGVEWDSFIARDHIFPDLERYTHLLLTGSEASILEREPWVDTEAALVAEAVEKGLPILGSCWGHQLLAYALIGPGSVRRCPQPEIGWIPLHIHEENAILDPSGEAFAFSIHYDEVWDRGESFSLIASSEQCRVQAIKLKNKPVWGIQCHPEVDIPTARKFLADLIDKGFKGREFLLEALNSAPRDSGLVHNIVSGFIGGNSAAF